MVNAAQHVHTDDCYEGTKHEHTGDSTNGGGCYGKYVSETSIPCGSCGGSGGSACSGSFRNSGRGGNNVEGCNGQLIALGVVITASCSTCGASYSFTPDMNCTYCGKHWQDYQLLSGTPGHNRLTCSSCNGSGYSMYIPSHYEMNCGKSTSKWYKDGELCEPVCDKVVTSLTPSSPNQTVTYQGD